MSPTKAGTIHHIELWVPHLGRAVEEWGWLLSELGYRPFQDWEHGRSWRLDATYIVVEQSSDLSANLHDRLRPGLNHLAFHAGSRRRVDVLTAMAQDHGWELLFPEKHPFAGGEDHYAAYLASADGYEVELVADDHPHGTASMDNPYVGSSFDDYLKSEGIYRSVTAIAIAQVGLWMVLRKLRFWR